MAVTIASRVQETSNTTGTGPLTLAGATSGHRAFNGAVSAGVNVPFLIEQKSAGGIVVAWELAIGVFTAPNALTRAKLLFSSTGAALNLSASYTTYVSVVQPGELLGLHDLTTVSSESVDVITALDVSTLTFARARRTLGDGGTFDAAKFAGREKTGYLRSSLPDGSAGGLINNVVYGAAASRPAAAAGNAKTLYIASDETPPGYWYSDGSSWTNLAPFVRAIAGIAGIGSYADLASLPAAGTANRFLLQRDLGLLKRDTGSALEAALNKLTGSGVLAEAGAYAAFGNWVLCAGAEASTTSRSPTGYTKAFTFPVTFASAPLVVAHLRGAAPGDIGNVTGVGATGVSTTGVTVVAAIPSSAADIALGYLAFGPCTSL